MADIPTAPIDDFEDQSFYKRSSRGEVIKVLLLGAAVGLLIPLVSFLLERFFIEPVFCRSANSFGMCATGGLTAYYIATGVISIIAIILLANWQVFRPLLIAVGAAAALWGFKRYIGDMASQSAIEYYLFSAITFGLLYLLFYWIMRIRPFIISVILAILLVVVVRLVLIA